MGCTASTDIPAAEVVDSTRARARPPVARTGANPLAFTVLDNGRPPRTSPVAAEANTSHVLNPDGTKNGSRKRATPRHKRRATLDGAWRQHIASQMDAALARMSAASNTSTTPSTPL